MRAKLLGILILTGIQWCVNAANLNVLTIKQQATHTAIECQLSSSVAYRAFVLSHPTRVVLDLDDTHLRVDVRRIVKQGMIQAIRIGHPGARTLRLVFDTTSLVSVDNTHSGGISARPFVIRLNIKSAHAQLMTDYSARKNTTLSPLSARAPQKQAFPGNSSFRTMSVAGNNAVKHTDAMNQKRTISSHGLRDVVVVIDPGHGGKDPGARGPNHHVEKDVVLAIALKLKQLIDRKPGMRAVLTRQSDYYIGLRERLQIARKYNADIFIAIHADAFIHQHSHGASVFALSQRGATSEAARWLAEKENYSELGGVNLSGLDDHNGMIRTVLIDLSQTATIQAGLQMGGYILQYLGKMTTLHNVKVEQARFVVLKSPDIPSVLVETGFISNPNEERNLTNPQYQMRLSQAIFDGVNRYFYEHPIQGTKLEAMLQNNPSWHHSGHDGSWLTRFKKRS